MYSFGQPRRFASARASIALTAVPQGTAREITRSRAQENKNLRHLSLFFFYVNVSMLLNPGSHGVTLLAISQLQHEKTRLPSHLFFFSHNRHNCDVASIVGPCKFGIKVFNINVNRLEVGGCENRPTLSSKYQSIYCMQILWFRQTNI